MAANAAKSLLDFVDFSPEPGSLEGCSVFENGSIVRKVGRVFL